MEKETKEELKKLAKAAEAKLTESVLRWKHTKEGKKVPDKEILEHRSRLIVDQANKIIANKGKSILREMRKAYGKGKREEGPKD